MSPLCTCVFWFKISGSSSLQKEMPTPQDSGEFSQRLTLRGLHSLAGIGESWGKSRPAILLLWNWLQMEARQGVQSLLVPDTDRTWSAHHPRPVILQCRVAALLRVWAGLTVQGGPGLSVARKRLFWMQWLSAGLWVWGKARRLGSGGEVAGKRRGASRLGHRDDTHLRTFSSFSFQRPALPWKRRTMESSVLFPGLPTPPKAMIHKYVLPESTAPLGLPCGQPGGGEAGQLRTQTGCWPRARGHCRREGLALPTQRRPHPTDWCGTGLSCLLSETGWGFRLGEWVFSGLQRPLALVKGIEPCELSKELPSCLSQYWLVGPINSIHSANLYGRLCYQRSVFITNTVLKELTIQEGKQLHHSHTSSVKESSDNMGGDWQRRDGNQRRLSRGGDI